VDTPPRWRDGFAVPKGRVLARVLRAIRRSLFSKTGLAAVALFLAFLMWGSWVGDVRWPRPRANLLTVDGLNGGIHNVAFSPDGERVAFGRVVPVLSANPRVRGYRETGEIAVYAIDGRLLHSFAAHADRIVSVAWSPDGRHLASTGADRTLKVWEAASGKLVTTLVGANPADWWAGLIFHPDGTRLIVKGDTSVVVWDLTTAQPIRTFNREGRRADSAALSPDGQRLAVAWYNSGLTVLDLSTGQEVLTIPDNGLLGRATFSPDGQRLATVGFDGRMKLWDAATGEELLAFDGRDVVGCLAFSPDGGRLVTGHAGRNLTVQVWDTATGRRLDTRSRRVGVSPKLDLPPYSSNVGAVYGVSFHDEGLRVASTRDQRVAEVWEATTEEDAETVFLAGALLRYLLYTAVALAGAMAVSRVIRGRRTAGGTNAP
jgi:WD40 repeat protein